MVLIMNKKTGKRYDTMKEALDEALFGDEIIYDETKEVGLNGND